MRAILNRAVLSAAGLTGLALRTLPGIGGAAAVAVGTGMRFGLWAGLIVGGGFGLLRDRAAQ